MARTASSKEKSNGIWPSTLIIIRSRFALMPALSSRLAPFFSATPYSPCSPKTCLIMEFTHARTSPRPCIDGLDYAGKPRFSHSVKKITIRHSFLTRSSASSSRACSGQEVVRSQQYVLSRHHQNGIQQINKRRERKRKRKRKGRIKGTKNEIKTTGRGKGCERIEMREQEGKKEGGRRKRYL